MTDRERLIEILSQNIRKNRGESEIVAIANHLLTNGVIVPPCKVGDKLYTEDSLIDEYCYWEIVRIEIYEDESGFVDDSGNWYSFDDIGKTVFLTREEAEKALAERSVSDVK